MKLEIGENQGYVIIDDNTGKILYIITKNVVPNKFDFIGTHSYSRKGDKHYKLEFNK